MIENSAQTFASPFFGLISLLRDFVRVQKEQGIHTFRAS